MQNANKVEAQELTFQLYAVNSYSVNDTVLKLVSCA